MTVLDFDFRNLRIHGSVPCGEPEMHFDDIFDSDHEPFYRHAELHPTMTYQLVVKGDSMTGAGFKIGDVVFVDCSVEAIDGDIVIVTLNGEHTMKRLRIAAKSWQQRIELVSENPRYQPIIVSENDSFSVLGVVGGHYRKVRRG